LWQHIQWPAQVGSARLSLTAAGIVRALKSAVRTLTGLLVLVSNVFVSSAIFLVGAELDELLRKQAHGRHVTVVELLRHGYSGAPLPRMCLLDRW
jgi:hypothetical protein